MGYRLEGKMLEVCTCEVICPCWVGRDPDGGTCQGVIAYHFTSGVVDGVDVSGLTLGLTAHIPGNVLQGDWRVVVLLDENAGPEQEAALVDVFTGKAGGPVADVAALVGEIVDLQRVPITFDITEGTGRLEAGPVRADIESLTGATGLPTVLTETAFSSIPGSPAYVARSRSYTAEVPALGISLDIADRNAVQGAFRFEHAA
jgi:hypothetical protein